MRNGLLARRVFTIEDQLRFARLSGDWNPLHLDPLAARRTIFDAPVVHGVHLLLWALDAILERPTTLDINATFRKPATVGTEVTVEALALPENTVHLVANDGDQRVLDAQIVLRPHAQCAFEPVERAWDRTAPRLVAKDAIPGSSGQLPLALDRALARALLPNALASLGSTPLAELLAMTRLVGMEVPGLHSIFCGVRLAHSDSPTSGVLEYEIARANLKYSVVDLFVRGPTLKGTLETFYRPVPPLAPSNELIRTMMSPDELSHQRALVVGGSRGIGEAIARCIGLGGGEVCLTYHRGGDDAARIVEDLRAAGCRATALHLDVLAPGKLDLAVTPTHLYYLATPRIPVAKGFAMADVEHLMRYYVHGLYRLVEAAVGDGGPLHVWAPSTIFLDQQAGSVAYTIAKAAMEELARRLPSMMPVTVRAPRLPRTATDQTAALIQLDAAPALEVALRELRAMPR